MADGDRAHAVERVPVRPRHIDDNDIGRAGADGVGQHFAATKPYNNGSGAPVAQQALLDGRGPFRVGIGEQHP